MTYEFALRLIRWLLRAFFREVEVSGQELVPADRGGLVVSWHPNGIVDPALILGNFPGRIVFGARHGLFKVPGFGQLVRAIGCVPIYRPQDAGSGSEEERRARNRASLGALGERICAGSYSALFPEGHSHDHSDLQELKVGAARLYYMAAEGRAEGAPLPAIVPVGLHYDRKDTFRSSVLVAFHPPLELSPELSPLGPDASEEEHRARCTALTEAIRRALIETCHPTESWAAHHLMHRVRRLVRAERALRAGARPGAPGIKERALGFERVWRAYHLRRESAPQETAALMNRVEEYDADLEALGLADHQLDRSSLAADSWFGLRTLFRLAFLYLIGPIPLLLGLVINGPPYFLLGWVARVAAKQQKDVASVKWLTGALVFPLVWGLVGAAVWFGWVDLSQTFPERIPAAPWTAALATLGLAALGGVLALRYTDLIRASLRAVRVRLTRARYRASVERLRAERSALHDAVLAMAEGLELPGEVAPDGRVSR